MGSLIKNEIIKTIKKKSVIVFLIIFLLYMVLNNFIAKKYISNVVKYSYLTDNKYIESAKEVLKTLDPVRDSEEYITYKSDIELNELYNKYEKGSWQQYVVEVYLYQLIIDVNTTEYGTSAQKEAIQGNPKAELEAKIARLDSGDWKAFVNEDLASNKQQLEMLKAEHERLLELNDNVETAEVKNVNKNIKTVERNIELLQYRIDNSVPYGYGYMNDAINMIATSEIETVDLNSKDLSYSEKVAARDEIARVEQAKYILKTKQDVGEGVNLKTFIMSVFSDNVFFIFVFIAFVIGAIVSFEFEKGTIKMNLIRPHKRAKILLSKYIVSLIMMFGIMAFALLAELIIGGLFFGFDSLSNPVAVYSFTSNSIETYNVFAYLGIKLLHQLPMFLLITTLAFTISTVSTNTPISVALPILGYFVGLILNEMIIRYQVKGLLFFPTLNWDLSIFMFGALPRYQHTNFTLALVFSIIYLVIMLVTSFIVFNKKEIKNI